MPRRQLHLNADRAPTPTVLQNADCATNTDCVSTTTTSHHRLRPIDDRVDVATAPPLLCGALDSQRELVNDPPSTTASLPQQHHLRSALDDLKLRVPGGSLTRLGTTDGGIPTRVCPRRRSSRWAPGDLVLVRSQGPVARGDWVKLKPKKKPRGPVRKVATESLD